MTNPESIQYPAATEQKRVEMMHTIEIKSTPDKIFPLGCPVEELRWTPNWEYQLVYTQSGINEDNCIFREDMSGPILFGNPATTTWYTTLHDSDKCRVQWLLIIEDKAVIKWEFSGRETGSNTTTCTWNLIFTALNNEANELSEKGIKESLNTILNFVSNALKHYCETGKIIS